MTLLTVKEVAAMLRLSVNQTYLLKDKGQIPGDVRIGRAIRFDKDVIESWIRNGCPES